jgi:hypothetical protein
MNIPMACDVAMLVRIADPDDPTAAYLSECFHVITDGSLCSLANVTLPQEMIPNEMVLVQVVVWPWDALSLQQQQELDCPQGVTFDLSNVPSASPTPALGGQSFFQVGSSPSADVTIQCMNIEALNTDECEGFQGHLVARVLDMSIPGLFDVDNAKAHRLDVDAVGPTIELASGDWIIDDSDVVQMALGQIKPDPRWEVELPGPFQNALCVQVVDNFEFGRPTIRCVEANDLAELKEGVLIPEATLNKLSGAVGGITSNGAVIGVVLNSGGAPAAGVQITPDQGTVMYLNEDLTSINDGFGEPLTLTSASGAFVSVDADLGEPGALNLWGAKDMSIANGPNEQKKGIGGRVRAKLTFVKLELKPQ